MWEETSARVGAQYAEMMQKNAFRVIAPGTTNTDEGTDAVVEWDESDVEPPSGEGSDLRISNEWFLARTMDAVYLAEISGMRELEPAITGYALWFGGMNPGLPGDRVSGVAAGGPLTAASFIVGAGVPSVRPWSTWEWQRPHPLASVAAGFRGGFTFDNTEAASNTSILRDGVWLRATIAYEEFLHPGDGPAKAEPDADESEGMRVASTVASEDADGGASLLVTVVDPTGNPLSNVTVSGVWVGTRAEGQASEEVLRTASCVTVTGGSCSLGVQGDDQPGARPWIASITSLEHPDYAFDAATGSLGDHHNFE
jgi:hypothetical protein